MRIRGLETGKKARGRAAGVASGARAGGPYRNHVHPKWSSVPPDHLGHFLGGSVFSGGLSWGSNVACRGGKPRAVVLLRYTYT